MLAAQPSASPAAGSTGPAEEFDSPEGKALLKKWGVDERYIGVGHCILGYAANKPLRRSRGRTIM